MIGAVAGFGPRVRIAPVAGVPPTVWIVPVSEMSVLFARTSCGGPAAVERGGATTSDGPESVCGLRGMVAVSSTEFRFGGDAGASTPDGPAQAQRRGSHSNPMRNRIDSRVLWY